MESMCLVCTSIPDVATQVNSINHVCQIPISIINSQNESDINQFIKAVSMLTGAVKAFGHVPKEVLELTILPIF